MKKTFLIITIMLLSLILISCDDKEEKNDYNIEEVYIAEDIIYFNSFKDTTYKISINDKVVETKQPYHTLTEFPSVVKVKVIKDNKEYNYSKEFKFNEKEEVNNIVYNYNNDSKVEFNLINYLKNDKPIILNSEKEIVENKHYTNNKKSFVFNKSFLKDIDDKDYLYILSNELAYKLEFKINYDNKPKVINTTIYSDFSNPTQLFIDEFGFDFELNIDSKYYKIKNGIVTIDNEYLKDKFKEGRESLIIGYSFTKDKTIYTSIITLKRTSQ